MKIGVMNAVAGSEAIAAVEARFDDPQPRKRLSRLRLASATLMKGPYSHLFAAIRSYLEGGVEGGF